MIHLSRSKWFKRCTKNITGWFITPDSRRYDSVLNINCPSVLIRSSKIYICRASCGAAGQVSASFCSEISDACRAFGVTELSSNALLTCLHALSIFQFITKYNIMYFVITAVWIGMRIAQCENIFAVKNPPKPLHDTSVLVHGVEFVWVGTLVYFVNTQYQIAT